MRKQILLKSLAILAMFALVPTGVVKAVTNWAGGVQAVNVTDTILNISNTNDVSGHVQVTPAAVGGNIDVNIGAAAILDNNTAASALHFVTTDSAQTVTIHTTNDLLLCGGATGPFVTTFSGPGTLIWDLYDSTGVRLNDSGVAGNGAHFLIDIDSAAHVPAVLVNRHTRTSNNNVDFVIGANSTFSFSGLAASTGSAIISFDPANALANTGRMNLTIENTGGFLVQGIERSAAILATAWSNITWQTRVGTATEMRVINSVGATAWSGLFIRNRNATWTDLQANPWAETAPVLNVHQDGFVVGAMGILRMQNFAYMSYMAMSPNISHLPATMDTTVQVGRPLATIVKDRCPAALFVDGGHYPTNPAGAYETSYAYETRSGGAVPRAQFVFEGRSAMYFASAVDKFGLVPDATNGYVVPINQYTGAQGDGTILLDVEGPLVVDGTAATESAIEILSLAVSPVGGTVLIDSASTDLVFPRRSFALTQDDYTQYGKGNFFINNRTRLLSTNLKHTDAIHQVYDKTIPSHNVPTPTSSEPCYCGGETWWLTSQRPRPDFIMDNSRLLMHTSAAFTGVDLSTYEGRDAAFAPIANTSRFMFYSNGQTMDQNTGRTLILGTNPGSAATDLNSVIDNAAHCDVFQEFGMTGSAVTHMLRLETALNNAQIWQGLTSPSGTGIHTMFLGNATNVSIGSNTAPGTVDNPPTFLPTGVTFSLLTTPTFYVGGNYFSIESEGGSSKSPETSAATGEGGIFVDRNGRLEIGQNYRMNIGAMVESGYAGAVILPMRNVFFDNRIGLTSDTVSLATPNTTPIIASGEHLSDYTFDWTYINKDYAAGFYLPWEPGTVPAAGQVTTVTAANLAGLPKVDGEIDQFQIKNSRIGDQAGLLLRGSTGPAPSQDGYIRECVLLSGYASATAPTAFVALEGNATLGLGSASRNTDSQDAQVKLGINGFTLCANGRGASGSTTPVLNRVLLNQDLIINNQAPILVGPNFVSTSQTDNGDVLYIYSTVPREIRIKRNGILDLSQFTAGRRIWFGGLVSLVFEPGARILFGGGTIDVADSARFYCQPADNSTATFTTVADLDNYRVRLLGSGTIKFSENSEFLIPRGAYVGVESAGYVLDSSGAPFINAPFVTNLTLEITDSANMLIGSKDEHGGVFQVGNTTDRSAETQVGAYDPATASVGFTLKLDSQDALFNLDTEGFVGFGAGIVRKTGPLSPATDNGSPENWLAERLYNTGLTTFTFNDGTFKHNEIYTTDTSVTSSKYASILAFAAGQPGDHGPTSTFTFAKDTGTPGSKILGGGNLILLTTTGAATVAPTVRVTAGAISSSQTVGLMASDRMLADSSVTAPAAATTAALMFNYFALNDYNLQATKRSTLSRTYEQSRAVVAGYIDGTIINRFLGAVIGAFGATVDPEKSLEYGAVGIALNDATRAPAFYSFVS